MKKVLTGWLLGLALLAGAEAPRVISLSPALTELVCHLGRRDLLVGRSDVCDYPAEVKSIPAVGVFAKPAMERVAAVGGKLVISDQFQDASVVKSLQGLGLEVKQLPLTNLGEYRRAVVFLGEKLEAKEAAEREVARIDRVVAEYRSKYGEGKVRPAVLFVVWHDPMMSPGKTSFVTELIALAGGRNIGEDEGRDYFRCSAEWVVRMKPEVIIYPGAMGNGAKFEPPGWWKTLPAMKSGRFYRPSDENLFFRLSPRFSETLAELEKCIQQK